ncbi:MAG: 4-oxalocrotonate tautomerase family protein [Armatimonadetes bacterium]|nr:4-oxalocrotonate tautomerase family protein [Armatimonadota bacterium]
MPVIQVDGPQISVDKKRELARRLTEVAAEVYEMGKEHIIVLIRENPPENVAVGGELIVDRRKGTSAK